MLTPSEPNHQTVHLINSLGLGGAETMLFNCVQYSSKVAPTDVTVISLLPGGHFAKSLRSLGAKVIELDIRRHPIKAIRYLWINTAESNVLCSWSYHTNIIVSLLGSIKKTRKVWIINHEDTKIKSNKLLTWLIMKFSAYLSGGIQATAFNGEASLMSHKKLGYHSPMEIVVPNGCDTSIYSPSHKSSDYLMELIGKDPKDTKVILSAGRWHPIKDHATLISALNILKSNSNFQFTALLCGPNINASNIELMSLIHSTDLTINQEIFLLDTRQDLPILMASSDIFVLHSKSEAFPNVLIQAMSSGCRIVSTNVGVVAQVTKNTLEVVHPENPQELSSAIDSQFSAHSLQCDELGRTLRQIVIDEYSIENVVEKYEKAIFGS